MPTDLGYPGGRPAKWKAPELDSSDIASAKSAFMASLKRELIARGEDTEGAIKIMTSFRDRLHVVSRYHGPEVTLSATSQVAANVKRVADRIVEDAHEAAQIAAYGPDPVGLLRERLVKLGFDSSEALDIAVQRIRRLDNGQVEALAADGTRLRITPEFKSRVLEDRSEAPPTDEQLAVMRDPSGPLAAVAVAILDERDHAARANPQDAARHAATVRGSI